MHQSRGDDQAGERIQSARAEQVTTAEAFVQHRDELSCIDAELLPYSEDVYIAEAKLSASQKQHFHNTYYDNKALPLMQAKSAYTRRIQSLVP